MDNNVATNGDFRLASNSHCVNAGTNEDWMMTNALDLDGHCRLDRFSRIADMGCYEYLPSGAVFSVP